ncbi:hypothetical protein RSSM_00556 [Rhodopirellula sallentina SM41]|uniref:Uncharacterized protein n=1 Tax=Rhodopirellula sallentina SM41 TaxID=1263870 RepID=M5U9A5_9BACT|nr:hypothetical protein RSSM_00556 [Rhodopirellula sallentina SM41]
MHQDLSQDPLPPIRKPNRIGLQVRLRHPINDLGMPDFQIVISSGYCVAFSP